ncbi:hypothetical protein GIB67_038021 [Kingdonia uniflora]|uniref:DUF7610 domain-containing protein n=1 Tax=Kingdonia uniflora TaxID=39325 RepID=A0A7J7MCD4_9MAGN|nr:hypothetical protein GIB67_038021 [Kingdonia uniflora]
MAKRYAILQKKLEELESDLKNVLTSETPRNTTLSESVERKFGFARSLLTAEMESHPNKPQHLNHIDQRLTELETAFRNWDNPGFSHFDHIDTASTCSCTESCLNEDFADEEEPLDVDFFVYNNLEKTILGGVVTVEEDPVTAVIDYRSDREEWKEERVTKCNGVLRRAMMFLMVLGALIAMFFSLYYNKVKMEVFLVPT